MERSLPTPTVEVPAHSRGLVRQTPTVAHHVGLVLLCGGILLASFLLGVNGQNQTFVPPFSAQPIPEICPFKRVTGQSCAGCGITRSFISISHGDFNRAWNFNRAGFLLYAFLFAQLVYNAWTLFRVRQGRMVTRWRWLENFGLVVVAVMLGNWAWNLLAG